MTAVAALRTAARRVTRALSGGRSARGFRRRFGSAAAPLTALPRAARWLAAIGDARPRLLEGPFWGNSLAALTAARPFAEEAEDGSRAHRSGPRSRSRETRGPGVVSATTGRSPHRCFAPGRSAHRTSKSRGWRPAGKDRPGDRPGAPSPRSLDRRVECATLTRLTGPSVTVASGPGAEPRRRRARSLPAPSGSGTGGSSRPGSAPRPAREGGTNWRRSLEGRSRRRLAAAVAGERATRGPVPHSSASDDSTSGEPVWAAPFTGTQIRTEILLRLAEPAGPASTSWMPDDRSSARSGRAQGTDRDSARFAAPVAAHRVGPSSGRSEGEPSEGGSPYREGKPPSEIDPSSTSSRVPLSTWPWNRSAASASAGEGRLDAALSPKLPRQTAEGPEPGDGETGTPRLFGRSPAEPEDDDLGRLARGLERLLGDEARRFGIDL